MVMEEQGDTIAGLPHPQDEIRDRMERAIDVPGPLPELQMRAGRRIRYTTRWQESVQPQREGLVALMMVPWEVFHDDGYKIQDEMENLIAFVTSTTPDIMYLDEVMKQPDRIQFQEAMIKEVQSQADNDNWKVVGKDTVPAGTPFFQQCGQ
jgi:hypothetical protein